MITVDATVAKNMSEATCWATAFWIAVEAADLFPPDSDHSLHRFGAETVVRSLYKAMRERGITVIWPSHFGGKP